jgi:hypothetical protein
MGSYKNMGNTLEARHAGGIGTDSDREVKGLNCSLQCSSLDKGLFILFLLLQDNTLKQ